MQGLKALILESVQLIDAFHAKQELNELKAESFPSQSAFPATRRG